MAARTRSFGRGAAATSRRIVVAAVPCDDECGDTGTDGASSARVIHAPQPEAMNPSDSPGLNPGKTGAGLAVNRDDTTSHSTAR